MLPREHYLKQAFQDSIHFPNGFEKGGLSDIQARLIRKNGTLINALCIDEVSDPTAEDSHILKVIANQSSPRNPVEQAWIKYLSIVKSLDSSTPKGKGKSKAAKPAAVEATPETVKAAEKAEKPTKVISAPKVVSKNAAPASVEKKAKVAAPKTEKAEPVAKATTKKADPKKTEPVKVEIKKAEPKKTEPKKAEPKKPEPKKPELKKIESKKVDTKKIEVKKAEPKKPEPKKAEAKKVDAKKVETKKTVAKKTKA